MDTELPSNDIEIMVRAERLEELRRKEEELAVALEKIAHLKREVDHRLDEMNLQARWTREAQEKVERLRAALKPFALFASRWLSMAEPLVPDDTHVYQADDAKILAADLRAASKALEGT